MVTSEETPQDYIRPGRWVDFQHRLPDPFGKWLRRWDARYFPHGLSRFYIGEQLIKCCRGTVPPFRHRQIPDDAEDAAFLELILNSLEMGDTFIDIGSHYGWYSIAAAHQVGAQGKVIAFEPSPLTLQKLRCNIKLNQVEQIIEVREQAVADTASLRRFRIYQDYMNNRFPELKIQNDLISPDYIEVQTVTLDSLTELELDKTAVKMDVEGAEIAILRGASQLLNSQARIYVEIHPWAWGAMDTGWEELQTLVRSARRMIFDVYGNLVLEPRYCRVQLVKMF